MALNPKLLVADDNGNIRDMPHLLMLCSQNGAWRLPEPDELEPLPEESELFMLPGRKATGRNISTGADVITNQMAVAAFAAPGHTVSAHPAYMEAADAPLLPLFAYAAVGFAKNKFWICARKVDTDQRQQFKKIKHSQIEKSARQLLNEYPQNRLVSHIINNCVRKYDCPAARNFALGRYEAPLPTSNACNARCLACISSQADDSPVKVTPQCRMNFIPAASEIVEVMLIHEKRETNVPIYSFGQGCEGDPLINADLLAESIYIFRNRYNGKGTINCNTNASNPKAVKMLCEAGLTSLRASINSARPKLYEAYYRPLNYTFADVEKSLHTARKFNIFISLNLLYFPGITDTMEELEALAGLCKNAGVSMIQWRNLNIDPLWFLKTLKKDCHQIMAKTSRCIGLQNFMHLLRKKCPWLRYGYFNPFVGEKAVLSAPQSSA